MKPNYEKFAKTIVNHHPDMSGWDGFDLQKLAIDCGLLKKEIRIEFCDVPGGACTCRNAFTAGRSFICYRKAWK